MFKTVLIAIAGLFAGFAIATWLPSDSSGGAPPADEPDAAGSPGRLDARPVQLGGEVEQRVAALERQVLELNEELDALRAGASEQQARAPQSSAEPDAARRDTGETPASGGDAFPGRWRALREDSDQVERLIAAGFSPERAEWIGQRTSELRMQALQAQYDARREGTPLDPAAAFGGEQTLRAQLGEADYERYLEAIGRPTRVAVREVLASSPAEQAGFKTGDQIVAYAGDRVFDIRDLNRLTLEGRPGEPVVVDVVRDGQQIQLVIPRGPVGVSGGGRFAR